MLLDRTYMPADGVYTVDIEIKRNSIEEWPVSGRTLLWWRGRAFWSDIFDFDEDIYGETVTVYWLDRIRDMVKFDGIEQLVKQLEEDEKAARI